MITVLLVAAWLIGVGAAAWSVPGGAAASALLAGVCGGVLAPRRPALALCAALACAGVGLLAAARWHAAQAPLPPDNIRWFAGSGSLIVLGTARADAEDRGRTRRIELQVEATESGGERQAASGGILARVPAGVPVRAGDELRLYGTVSPPPQLDGFDYPAYFARHGLHATMEYPGLTVTARGTLPFPRNLLVAGRRTANRALDRFLPFPESALARGIITGDRSAMPRALTEDFNRSGTSHLIAISGFNITLIGMMATVSLTWLVGRRRATLAALLLITAYALFVGLSASVARAWIMGMLAIGITVLGRPGAPALALGLAAAAMTAQDPTVINDAGFQLSFSATAGLMVLSAPLARAGEPLIARLLGRGRLATIALAGWSAAAVTVAASLATLPVMLHTFGRISLIAPLPNLLLVPLFPLVMVTSGMVAVLSPLAPWLGSIAGAIAWAPLAATIAVVRQAAAVPGSGWSLPSLPGWAALAGYLVAALLIVMWRKTPGPGATPDRSATAPFRPRPVLLATLLLLAVGGMLTWDSLRSGGDGQLHVTYGESGGTPLAVVTGPGGEHILVLAGQPTGLSPAAIDALLPGRQKRAALIILTRPAPVQSDNLAAMVGRYQPRAVLAPPRSEDRAATSPGWLRDLPPNSRVHLSGSAVLEVQAGPERGQLTISANHGRRRFAVTPDAMGDLAVRPGSRSATGAPILETMGGEPWFDLRRQGPVDAATDGQSLRLSPAR